MASDRASRPGAVAALCLVQFVDVLGVTVVVTALPAMLKGVGAPRSAAGLVVTGYAMFFGGLLMLGARLGDRYGHRRVLLAGLATFAAASLLAATATSLAALIAARCAQGAGAAGSVPAALRLLSTATHSDERARRRALAAWSATGAAAGASGFLLGGVLTELTGWRTIFWLNLPLAVLLALAVLRSAPPATGDAADHLDVLGAGLLTAAVIGLVLGSSLLERPGHRAVGLLLVASGGLLLAAFARVERAVPNPLLPGRAVRHRNLRIGAAAAFMNTATTSSVMTLATLHLQDTRGASPAAAGVTLLPFSLCVVLGSALAARVLHRRHPGAGLAGGLGLIAVGDAALLALPVAEWLLPACLGVAGLGIGLSSVAATTLCTNVPAALQATAAGVLNTAAQLGTALGVAVVLLIATSTQNLHLPLDGTPLGWACAAAAAAASALLSHTRSRLAIETTSRTSV
jgi:MFS family permease